jgi:hypothetical protein
LNNLYLNKLFSVTNYYGNNIIKPQLKQVQKPLRPIPKMFEDPGRPLDSKTNKLSNELISKSICVSCEPLAIPAPSHVEHCWFPQNLLEIAVAVANQPSPKFKHPTFCFEMSPASASKNWEILSEFKDLGEALQSQKGTQLEYGSEFRDTKILKNIFAKHPLWSRLEKQLIHGTSFPLEELDFAKRKEDVREALDYGNHKGVVKLGLANALWKIAEPTKLFKIHFK